MLIIKLKDLKSGEIVNKKRNKKGINIIIKQIHIYMYSKKNK